MRFILLFCLSLLFLAARENPFKPIIDNTVLPVTSNKIEKAPPFRKVKVQLPVDARVLTSVAIYYQSLDGSIKKEIVAIDRSVDWHNPIVITQAETEKSRKTKSPKQAVSKTESSVSKKSHKKPSAGKKPHRAKEKQSVAASLKTVEYSPLPFVSLKFEKHSIRIVTGDEKIRAFHLTNPFKVAVDFRRKAAFLTKHRTLETPPFKAVDIGNHKGYYRVVITFDAPYRYTISKIADGYIISLR